MAIDRDDTLRKAEKLLRQGRLDAAIAEYARVVDEQPRDWTTANLLGDLYVRAGLIDRAVAQYARIADQLAREGFLSKATALYKKIVRIHPDDDTALLRAAELASQQGLGADARGYLQTLFHQRLRRGDRPGASKIAVRLAEIDPNDAVGRLEAARLLVELGDSAAAGEQLRAAGQALSAAGKVAEGIRAWREALRFNPGDGATRSQMVKALLDLGDPDAAREVARQADDLRAVADGLTRAGRDSEALSTLEQALAAEPDNAVVRLQVARAAMQRHAYGRAKEILAPAAADPAPAVQLALAEAELRTGRIEQGTAAVARALAAGPELAGRVEDLGCDLARDMPDAGYAVIVLLLTRAEAAGDVEPAMDALERFSAAAAGHVAALEQVVRLSRGGFNEDRRYRAQARLADAYLASERWANARALSEQLLDLRPDDAAHVTRLARALVGLGIPDAETVANARVRRVPAPEDLAEFVAGLPARSPMLEPVTGEVDSGPPIEKADPVTPDSLTPDRPTNVTVLQAPDEPAAFDIDLPSREVETPPDLPGAWPGTGQETGEEPEVYEIDLSGDLEELLREASSEPIAPASTSSTEGARARAADDDLDLEGFFQQMRESAGREGDEASAARAYDRASEYCNQGNLDEAVAYLREAVRDASYRFRAASMLARIARGRQQLRVAVEWLERAAEAPAPTLQAAHALLYELADTLEAAGEPARALAVLLELQAAVPGYRDIAERAGRLAAGQAGGAGPRKGSA